MEKTETRLENKISKILDLISFLATKNNALQKTVKKTIKHFNTEQPRTQNHGFQKRTTY